MNVDIQLLPGAEMPKYHTQGSVGFDLHAYETTTIPAKSIGLIRTGTIIAVPSGYALHLLSRSSTPKKKGLLIPHGVGLIDQDYCGCEDELLIQVYNFTDTDCVVSQGERIAQGVFVQIGIAEFTQTTMKSDSRGGFGSTN